MSWHVVATCDYCDWPDGALSFHDIDQVLYRPEGWIKINNYLACSPACAEKIIEWVSLKEKSLR